nr:hypothetical protein [Tanacetum cinerariifolium]
MEIPGYTANSDPEEDEEDPKEDPADQPADGGDNDDNESSDDDDDDVEKDEEDEKEEEEHLALADPSVVLIDDHVPSSPVLAQIQSQPLIMLEVGGIANLALQGSMGGRERSLQSGQI